MNRLILILAAALLGMPHIGFAQHSDLEARLRPFLAPPELVMRYQSRLGITAEQRDLISAKVGELQADVLNLQWQMEEAGQALIDEVSQDTIDVDAAILHFERVVGIEASIKRNHIGMLLEIRNALNPDQRRILGEILEEAAFRERQEETARRRDEALRHHNPVR